MNQQSPAHPRGGVSRRVVSPPATALPVDAPASNTLVTRQPGENRTAVPLETTSTPLGAHAAPYWVCGRVAVFTHLLDEDGRRITTHDEALGHGLLSEWEHLGQTCVCREALPPMPRLLPSSLAAERLAAMEANVPGSSTMHLVSVEFADGFRTALQYQQLRCLP